MAGSPYSDWTITPNHFLVSTAYLFCQYFCWIRLLEESLSFELFRNQSEKDELFKKIWTVRDDLSQFPLTNAGDLPARGDRQIFTLQQRALGELLIVQEPDAPRCMRFAEFMNKRPDPIFASGMEPIASFLDGLSPEQPRRWERLLRTMADLEALSGQCRHLLNLRATAPLCGAQ